ncbi:hypothetical protein VB773_09495 [Haloarculaceae archaeon H-GB2-1]|nr:hypothetical protein [Haloarculaceae archaeon H-GB11]MEA5407775.1 hypothetical protein [Haloarculaceae archaeon H-GB2-1]
MAKPRYDDLKSFLADRFGDSLRWVASFDSDSYTYNVRWIRDDLKTDLSNFDFDTIVHRSMAVFNRRHVEDVYFHLGDANSSSSSTSERPRSTSTSTTVAAWSSSSNPTPP